MRVFDRGKEMIGDERTKEIEEMLWYRELLTTESVFGGEEDDEEEVDWDSVDSRELGMYWELNDGTGKEYGKVAGRRYRKDRFGWSELKGKVWRVVRCGEMFDKNGVCMCSECERTVNPYR